MRRGETGGGEGLSGYRKRAMNICTELPEVTADVASEPHIVFRVRGKSFAYYVEDHHGDGEIAMVCKAAPGMNTAMIEADSVRFFMPAYVGPKGWIAVRLDAPEVDWDEIEDLIIESYSMVAPQSLVKQIPRATG